jgi:hypothetical protein
MNTQLKKGKSGIYSEGGRARPLAAPASYLLGGATPRPTKVLGRLHGSANEWAEPAPTSYFFFLYYFYY